MFRGYLGAGLRHLKGELQQASSHRRPAADVAFLLSMSIPEGPSKRAWGCFVGDIIISWNGKPIDRVRDVMHLLGPESVGTSVDLGLIRGGASATLQLIIGERPLR